MKIEYISISNLTAVHFPSLSRISISQSWEAGTSCLLHKHWQPTVKEAYCITLPGFLVRSSNTKHKLTQFAQSKKEKKNSAAR